MRILLSIVLCVSSEIAFAGPDSPQKESPPKRLLPHPDDIKPLPLTPIPDNPPPHEGAMIGLPQIISPPDLVLIEVLETQPGRPISGERLVRPDGVVSLGFYGEVALTGLTPVQAKEKVVLHLRKYLSDEVLGLTRCADEAPRRRNPLERDPLPGVPPLPQEDAPQHPKQTRAQPRSEVIRRAGRVSPVVALQDSEDRETGRTERQPLHVPAQEKAPRTSDSVSASPGVVTVNPSTGVKITIQVNPASPETPPTELADENPPTREVVEVEPKDTNRVFVDITAYNSMGYFIQGAVAAPGRLPWTGNETVLDVLNYAGGLICTSDPKNIRLVRPARGGKPARSYPIDLEAIRDKGDKTANLQIFPGDRLVVGRLAKPAAGDAEKKAAENADAEPGCGQE